jgi:hypothetical protein
MTAAQAASWLASQQKAPHMSHVRGFLLAEQ